MASWSTLVPACGGALKWLNSRLSRNTTITVEVMADPKMVWNQSGNWS